MITLRLKLMESSFLLEKKKKGIQSKISEILGCLFSNKIKP